MSILPDYFFAKMSTLLEHQPKDVMYLIRNCYLVGSTVANNVIDLENDNDIDLYYYEAGKKRNKNMMRLYNSFSSKCLNDVLEIDLLSFIATDKFYNNSKKCLTDYIFGEKKEAFSKKIGQIRALNLEGFFITKLAALSCRDEEKDREAIKAVLAHWNNVLPKEAKAAIKDYNLTCYYEEFE